MQVPTDFEKRLEEPLRLFRSKPCPKLSLVEGKEFLARSFNGEKRNGGILRRKVLIRWRLARAFFL